MRFSFDSFFEVINVADWPKRPRRIFVALLPITVPLWVLYILLISALFVLFTVVLLPIAVIAYLWEGPDAH